jgi:hypothetical protein
MNLYPSSFRFNDRSVKTLYIYKMSGRLVNVRLDEQRLKMAQKLRGEGIALSDLVREGIARRYDQLVALSKPRDVTAIMKRIYEQFPDSAVLPSRTYNAHNRTEAPEAILGKLRKHRRDKQGRVSSRRDCGSYKTSYVGTAGEASAATRVRSRPSLARGRDRFTPSLAEPYIKSWFRFPENS